MTKNGPTLRDVYDLLTGDNGLIVRVTRVDGRTEQIERQLTEHSQALADLSREFAALREGQILSRRITAALTNATFLRTLLLLMAVLAGWFGVDWLARLLSAAANN